jgi:RNA polymerase sigma-70 factor (ECF subfamily)
VLIEGSESERLPIGVSSRQERAWVRAAQDGSKEAFERLFGHHWPATYRAAYLVTHDAMAAEDIAQEAFLSALRTLGRFDRRRPFGPWIHRIVVNRAIDHVRSRNLRRETEVPETYEAPGSADEREISDEVIAALRTRPVEHRAVVVLRHLLGYTPGEIAKLLDVPRGTVNSRLRRGLNRLEREIGKQESPR